MCEELMNRELWAKVPNKLKLRYSIGKARINQTRIYSLITTSLFTIMALIFWVSGSPIFTLGCYIVAIISLLKGINFVHKRKRQLIRTLFREVAKE